MHSYQINVASPYSIEMNFHNVTVGHIGQASEDKHPTVLATIGKTKMKVLLDTGSSVNLLDRKQFEILNRHNKIALTKAQPKIYTYGSQQPPPIKGKFQTTVEAHDRIAIATFYVSEGDSGSLIGYNTAADLGLVHVPYISTLPTK